MVLVPDVSVCILHESIESLCETEDGLKGVEDAIFGRMRPTYIVVVAKDEAKGGWSAERLGEWSQGVSARLVEYEYAPLMLERAREMCA